MVINHVKNKEVTELFAFCFLGCYELGGGKFKPVNGEDGANGEAGNEEDADEEAKHPTIVKNGNGVSKDENAADPNATTVTYTAEDEKKEKKEEGDEEEKAPLKE